MKSKFLVLGLMLFCSMAFGFYPAGEIVKSDGVESGWSIDQVKAAFLKQYKDRVYDLSQITLYRSGNRFDILSIKGKVASVSTGEDPDKGKIASVSTGEDPDYSEVIVTVRWMNVEYDVVLDGGWFIIDIALESGF